MIGIVGGGFRSQVGRARRILTNVQLVVISFCLINSLKVKQFLFSPTWGPARLLQRTPKETFSLELARINLFLVRIGGCGTLTSYPRRTARWKDSSCRGMTLRMPCRQSTQWGTLMEWLEFLMVSQSSLSQMTMGRPCRTNTRRHQRDWDLKAIVFLNSADLYAC